MVEINPKIKELENISLNRASINFEISKVETKITQLNPGQSSAEVDFSMESDLSEVRSVLVNTSGLIETKRIL